MWIRTIFTMSFDCNLKSCPGLEPALARLHVFPFGDLSIKKVVQLYSIGMVNTHTVPSHQPEQQSIVMCTFPLIVPIEQDFSKHLEP